MSSSIPATAPPSAFDAFDAFVAEPEGDPHANPHANPHGEDLNGGYRALQPTITIDRAAAIEESIRHAEWLADYAEGHR